MAFEVKGFKTISHIGSPDAAAGTNRQLHCYVTNDDAAAVQTANYFLPLMDTSRLKVGDQILCSLDIDGAPAGKTYVVVTATKAGVTIAAFTTA